MSVLLRTIAIIPAVLFGFDKPLSAQASPSQVVASAFAVLARHDWTALSALVDSGVLDSIRQESLGFIILVTEDRQKGKEGGGYNPGEVVVADHLARVGGERVSQFPHNPTIAELASLSAGEFFVRWCAAVYDPRFATSGDWDITALQRQMIGELLEGDTLAHVLYRREERVVQNGESITYLPGRAMIMSLRKANDRWLLLLNDDLGWFVDFMRVLHSRPSVVAGLGKATIRRAPVFQVPSEPPGPNAEVDAAGTVAKAFAAFEGGDWDSLGSLVDSEELHAFQRRQIAQLAAWAQSREARARARQDSVAVFMYSVEDSLSPEETARVASVSIPLTPHPRSIGELAALSPAAFFTVWCEAAYGNSEFGRSIVEKGRHVLGTVIENASAGHVLYRSNARYRVAWRVERVAVKWSGRKWFIRLNEDIARTGALEFQLDQP